MVCFIHQNIFVQRLMFCTLFLFICKHIGDNITVLCLPQDYFSNFILLCKDFGVLLELMVVLRKCFTRRADHPDPDKDGAWCQTSPQAITSHPVLCRLTNHRNPHVCRTPLETMNYHPRSDCCSLHLQESPGSQADLWEREEDT